jgi:putative PIN family toxin of toxin-antitoxin system
MQEKKLKIILDTNILISMLLSGNFRKYDKLFYSSAIQLQFSVELLEELFEVVNRPKFTPYFSSEDVDHLFYLLGNIGKIIHVYTEVNICRDPKDNFILALAHESKADLLVTGDIDLLSMKSFHKTEIIRLNQLEGRLP